MRRSNCAGALQYVPELTWILFLRILDERETREAEEAAAVDAEFAPSLEAPYRWQDWAAPGGAKRKQLQNGALGAFFGFVNGELIPLLKKLRGQPNAAPRRRSSAKFFPAVERTRIDTERNFLDVLDKVKRDQRGRRLTRRTCSRFRRCMKGCCSRWARRAMTADNFHSA